MKTPYEIWLQSAQVSKEKMFKECGWQTEWQMAEGRPNLSYKLTNKPSA